MEIVEIPADVLVIGAGPAGCYSAIRAKETVEEVVVVCKAKAGSSGAFLYAGGILAAPVEKANILKWVKGGAVSSEYTDDQNMLKKVLELMPTVTENLEKWGMTFLKKDGKRIEVEGMHRGAPYLFVDGGGLKTMWVLRGEMLKRGIRIIDRVMITDLLTSDGKHPTDGNIIGAIGFGVRDGKLYVFKSKATILATGNWDIQAPYSEHNYDLSGDGQSMALRAGAEMTKMEYIEWGTHLLISGGRFSAAMNPRMLGEGVVLDEEGNDLLVEYKKNPDLGRAIFSGEKMIYMSLRKDTPEELLQRYRVGPVHMFACEKAYNVPEDLQAQIPTTGDCGGGAKTDNNMSTSLPGLFAAGNASERKWFTIPGGSGAMASGWIAGKSAADWAMRTEVSEIKKTQVEELRKKIYGPLKAEKGLRAIDIRRKIWDIYENDIQVWKDEEGLNSAIKKLGELKEQASKVMANNYHELMKANEVKNIIEVLDLVSRASLIRTETRMNHRRNDYPERDDKNWLVWLVSKKLIDGTIKFWKEKMDLPYGTP